MAEGSKVIVINCFAMIIEKARLLLLLIIYFHQSKLNYRTQFYHRLSYDLWSYLL